MSLRTISAVPAALACSLAAEADSAIVVSTYGQEADGGLSDEEELLRATVVDGC